MWQTAVTWECICTHSLPCSGNEFFKGWCGTFSKCIFSLTHCRADLYSLSLTKLFKISSKVCPSVDPNFFGTILFCNLGWQCSYSFLESLYSSPLHLLFDQTSRVNTSKYFTPLFSFASLSTKARSIYRLSFSKLTKAFFFSFFHVAVLNFVYEVFECKVFLAFDTGGMLAFTNLPTDS